MILSLGIDDDDRYQRLYELETDKFTLIELTKVKIFSALIEKSVLKIRKLILGRRNILIYIQGNRILLKSFSRDEYHNLYRIYVADPIMDPNVYIYDEEKVNKHYDAIIEKESWYPRVGIFLEAEQVIGQVSFKRIDNEKSQCELGIILAKDEYKKHGYGTEAIGLSIRYVFDILELKYLYADTMGSNVAMQKIFKKMGFEYIRTEEQRYDMHDRWEDKLYYVLRNPKIRY